MKSVELLYVSYFQESSHASVSMVVSVATHNTPDNANAAKGSMEHSVNQVNIINLVIFSTPPSHFSSKNKYGYMVLYLYNAK